MTTVLQVDQLVAGYEPAVPIVKGVSVTAERGELVAVLGPNGAGKSTLVRAIAGLVPVTGGRVLLEGDEVTATAPEALLRMGLAYVPQTDNVFTTLTVEDNLMLAVQVLPRALRADRLAGSLDYFPDLKTRLGDFAGRLSGGQRQMLAVARALMTAPRVLLLDEPSAGLSPKFVGETFDRLRVLCEAGLAILLVEQNVRAALRIADRAYVLAEGQNRMAGTARSLAVDPALARLYLGGGVTGSEPA
jgi:branched-chain amino acid transport system ATP-binding protein